ALSTAVGGSFLSGGRKFRSMHTLTSAARRQQREVVNDDLENRRSAGIEDDVLPSPGSRRNERLVNLVQRSGDHGHEHADRHPFQSPEVVQVHSPASS